MNLRYVWGRLPITGEPLDGYLIVGGLLTLLAGLGLFTGAVGAALCGLLTVAGVGLLVQSGRDAAEAEVGSTSGPEGSRA